SLGRCREAMDMALARRDLWQNNSERLLSVASELVGIARQSQNNSKAAMGHADRQKLDEEVVTTLRQAIASGRSGEINLAGDPGFSNYRGNRQFTALLAELNESTVDSMPRPAKVGASPSAAN